MGSGAFLCCFLLCLVVISVKPINEPQDNRELKDIRDILADRSHDMVSCFCTGLPTVLQLIKTTLFAFIITVRIEEIMAFISIETMYLTKTLREGPFLCCPITAATHTMLWAISVIDLRCRVLSDRTTTTHREVSKETDRLVVRVERDQPQRVLEVYITQHYENRNRGSGYDPDNTFRVNPSLLRQIQALRSEDTGDTCDSNDPRQGLSTCQYRRYQRRVNILQRAFPPIPGLAWFMILAGYNMYHRNPSCPTRSITGKRDLPLLDTNTECEAYNKMKLRVKATTNGYARISWSRIPEHIVRKNSKIGLYKDESQQQSLVSFNLDGRTYGTIDTNWALNPGLQVKLSIDDKVIYAGPEFNDANGVLPTDIKGYDASLQLYTKDGYACARIFIQKSFSDWQTAFKDSWVGFYKSTRDDTQTTYQWVIKLQKNTKYAFSEDYDIYEYTSGQSIGPGVQARFLLDKGHTDVRARTDPWEGVNNPYANTHDELRKSVEPLKKQ